MVGALLLNPYQPHPLIKQETVHIGFIGYDRDTVGLQQARSLKKYWLEVLRTHLPKSGLVSASIFWFNQPSLNFHQSIGLKPKFLRIEGRLI